MKKTGYVIAKNKSLLEFFTASSAYDRPKWVTVNEATAYPTAELAQTAATKLYKSSGAYEARIIAVQHLQEARGRDMSYTEQPYDDSDESDIMPDGAIGGAEGTEARSAPTMTAKVQGDAESPEADDQGMVDPDHPSDDDEDHDDEQDREDIETDVNASLGDDDMSAEPHATDEPSVDQMDDEDDGTVGMPGEDEPVDAPAAGFDEDEPDFEAPPAKRPGVAESAEVTVADASDKKIKVPAGVKSDLKAAIAEFEKSSKFANTRDDDKATFCMTVAEAFSELLTYLEDGTVDSIKRAQIHMAGLMSPIANHLPESVKRFVLSGGRTPTLKDFFELKRDAKKRLRESDGETLGEMLSKGKSGYNSWYVGFYRGYKGLKYQENVADKHYKAGYNEGEMYREEGIE